MIPYPALFNTFWVDKREKTYQTPLSTWIFWECPASNCSLNWYSEDYKADKHGIVPKSLIFLGKRILFLRILLTSTTISAKQSQNYIIGIPGKETKGSTRMRTQMAFAFLRGHILCTYYHRSKTSRLYLTSLTTTKPSRCGVLQVSSEI